MYREVPPRVDLPQLDHEVLDFWRDNEIFEKSLAQTVDDPPWVFYEGPPTANGSPGAHHVEARVFKDIFPRYRTMKGRHVPRRAGFDCHGLPVELFVEKELGFSGKGDIEKFGIAEFNLKCRESVLRHVDEFIAMSERMGYWVDFADAYYTMAPSYVESVWWSLKQTYEKGLLVRDHRVGPYCPRCGTTLSDHELSQGYETVVDRSVYVKLPLTSGPIVERHPEANLLVWTTTPWTLVSNTAVAVNPELDYVLARSADAQSDARYVVAKGRAEELLGEGFLVEAEFKGQELTDNYYQRPFELVDVANDSPAAFSVVTADYVTAEDGSGLVHIAPAFGDEDMAVGRKVGLPVLNPIAADGTFEKGLPLIGQMFFKDADSVLIEDLMNRNLLVREDSYEHQYPHCWRCHTRLMYYAQPAWYVKTTEIKPQLLRENEATNWHPESTKWGRYGDWLNNNVDWALSRNRFWGTPLPIWICENDHKTVVGSLAELGKLANRDVSELDPHRPFVDAITFPCPVCAKTATRVPEVIDVWYDSGAMPFAQWGYPHKNAEEFKKAFPADFICEALDQTRGWFYTLMAISTLVFDQSSYRNVLCLGHILDDKGRKMSKHLGNVLEPIALMDEHGADAVRWFMLAAGSPWQSRRLGHQNIDDVVRKVLLTYWNTASFLSLYGRVSEGEPPYRDAPPPSERPVMDRWAISQAHWVVNQVDLSLESFDSQKAGKILAGFIDDLSNWYVRRTRRRFWAGDLSALATLHEVMRMVTLAMAPFTPFITERVWQDLFASVGGDAASVHLAKWPEFDSDLVIDGLATQVELVRRLTELGRGARAASKVKVRQPLPRALVSAAGWAGLPTELRDELAEELNILAVSDLATTSDLVTVVVKPNFRTLGAKFGDQTQAVAKAVGATDAAGLAMQLRESGSAKVSVPGELGDVTITPDDVVITEQPREGWAVASNAGETLALDLTLTPELRRTGLAREVIRLIQEARKTSGFEVSDRIVLNWWASDPQTAQAIEEHGATIASEVLATQMHQERSANEPTKSDAELKADFWLTKA